MQNPARCLIVRRVILDLAENVFKPWTHNLV